MLVGLPALVIAGLGLVHPVFLTPATADRWRLVHLLLLPAFPLVAGSVLWLLRRATGLLPWVARIAALAYALLYGALDSIAGIGAPALVQARGSSAPIGDLFVAGDQLGRLGVVGLAIALAATGVVLVARGGGALAVGGGALAAVSCWWFYLHHVFAPRGVLALVGIGIGCVLMGLAEERGARETP